MSILPEIPLQQNVTQIVADILGQDSADITEESGLDTTPGWDSLQHLSIIMTLEEELGVRIEPEDFAEARTVAAIVALFARLVSQSECRGGSV